MTLATKNGALILKDGKLAENCGCCGDWYCCANVACVNDTISSVTVSISAANYTNWATQKTDSATIGYVSTGFYGTTYNGTHSLLKRTDGFTRWEKTFAPTPHVSCQTSVVFEADATPYSGYPGRWLLSFTWGILSYLSINNPVYKQLDEMTCQGISFAGWPIESRGPSLTRTLIGPIDQCGTLIGLPASGQFQAIVPLEDFESGAIYKRTVRDEGSRIITVQLSVS